MLGPGAIVVATVVLATLSAGGLAYALMFGRIQRERAAGLRLEQIQGDRTAERANARMVDEGRRRKSLQETLKEIETQRQQKADRNKISITRRISQAGLSWSRRTFYLISLGTGAGAVLIALILGFPLYAVIATGIAGGLGLPRWIVNRIRKRRMTKFLDEFANSTDVIVRGVKAGLPLNECIQIVATEASEPVKGEFQRVVEAQRMGMSIADAIEKMPEHVPLAEVNFFAIVVSIQQRAGGNLSEALENLSRVLRERKKMIGKIKAMSMEAKASAVIIAALPFTVMILVYLTSPDYIMLLFTERLGNVMLGFAAFWMTLGVLVMRKMINFDF